LHLTGLHEALK